MRLGDAYLVSTSGFLEIDEDERAIMMEIAVREVGSLGKNKYGELIPDFIVFDPSPDAKKGYEDDKRSLRIPIKTIPEKVYAKLDDYGSPATLSEQVGHPVKIQYVLTFMLAQEY
jgi:hypothetical protein